MTRNAPAIVGKDYRPSCGCNVLPWDDCEHSQPRYVKSEGK